MKRKHEAIDPDIQELSDSESIILLDEDNECSFAVDVEQCNDEQNNSAFFDDHGTYLDMKNVVTHITPVEKKGKRNNSTCFNCLGSHNLVACPETRDNRRISRNRATFQTRRSETGRLHEQNVKRYYPGEISDSLREALGIGHREIPEWIFRMRKKGFIDGYPPAYVKRAVEKNVLLFLTSDTKKEEEKSDEIIDEEKMVVYPGFNHYDSRLLDPERFRIPPWKNFIMAHQEVLAEKNQRAQFSSTEKYDAPSTSKRVIKKTTKTTEVVLKKKSKKKKARISSLEEGEIIEDDEDSSVVVLEENATEVSCDNQESEDEEEDGEIEDGLEEVDAVLEDGSSMGTNNEALSDEQKATNGVKHEENPSTIPSAPLRSHAGTPILFSKNVSKSLYNHEVVKPDLKNFAKDILPFQHQNIMEESGFFSKVIGLVKSMRKK